MLIKFCKHGTGSARKAYTYLIQKKDWTGKDRKEVRVIRGDPQMVAEVSETLKFVHRYTSAVIAWSPDDHPSTAEIEEVVDDFEKTAFSGLSPERYQWSAILHRDDKGGVHVHVFAARVELQTGKSLNIAPPGWQRTFDELCRYYNYKKGWARPDDPARSRTLCSDYSAYIEAGMLRQGLEVEPQPRNLINAYIEQKVKMGLIRNRADVLYALQEAGFEIPRAGKNYITVKDPESEIKFRLKGALYDQEFNVQSYQKPGGTDIKRADADRGIDDRQAKRAFRKLEEKRRKRTKHNQKVYGGNQDQTRTNNQVESGSGVHTGSGPGKNQKSDQSMDISLSHRPVSLPGDLSGKLGRKYLHGQGYKHEDRTIANSQSKNQEPGTDPKPSHSKDMGSGISRDAQGKVFDISKRHGAGHELDVKWEACIEAVRQLGGKDDGIRNQVKRNIDQSFQAIQAGSGSAGRSHQGLAAADRALGRTAAENIRVFPKYRPVFEKGIRTVVRNSSQELDRFKKEINFLEFVQANGYKIDQDRSCPYFIVLCNDQGCILVASDPNGDWVYYSLQDDQDKGTIIDFVQQRTGKNSGQTRKILRPWLKADSWFDSGQSGQVQNLPKLKPSTRQEQKEFVGNMRKRVEGEQRQDLSW